MLMFSLSSHDFRLVGILYVINIMGMASLYIPMVRIIKENSNMAFDLAKEASQISVVVVMMANGWMIRKMAVGK